MNDPDALTERDMEVIRAVLRAAVDGPFFPDWEFQTLMGVERGEMRGALEAWPNVEGDGSALDASVHNAIANLLGYPHDEWEAWSTYGDADGDELEQVLHRWRRYVRDRDWVTHPVEPGNAPVPLRPPISDMRVYGNIRSELAYLERRLAEASGGEAEEPLNLNQIMFRWSRARDDFGSWDRATLEMYVELLGARDELERFINAASFETRAYLLALIQPIDDGLRASTRQGDEIVLRVPGDRAGWWWYRVPLRPGIELRRALELEVS